MSTEKAVWAKSGRRKDFNLCNSCSNPPIPGKTRCKECDEKRKERVRASRLAGECIQDGCHNIPPKSKSRCIVCSEWRSAYDKKERSKRITAGLCAECGNQKNTKTKLCARCKKIALAKTHKYLFGGNKPAALKRDSNKCVLCSSEKSLVMHHVDGNRKANNVSNLITVCRRCHNDIHRLAKYERAIARGLVVWPGQSKKVKGSSGWLVGWKKIRQEILSRDNDSCQLCKAQHKRMFVHHKDDQGLQDGKPNNAKDNLITLCQACHNAVTNQRNNCDRPLAARLLIALGPGAQLAPLAAGQPNPRQPQQSAP